jgi:hypothetical protein
MSLHPAKHQPGAQPSCTARRRAAFIVACATLVVAAPIAGAQRSATPGRRDVPRADTVQHSPFIPGGHWRPGRPAPVPEPVPDVVAAAPSAVTDSAGYFARPNGALLQPGTTTYQITLRRDTLTIPLGAHAVTVSETMLAGASDWLIAESRTGTAIATSDSLYLRHADLAPVRWTARNGVSQLAVSFTQDSLFAALQDYQGRGSFASALPAGALITPGMVDRLLELLPLSAGYRVNATVVVIDSGVPRAVPATIGVEGEEAVTLSSGPVAAQSAADSLTAPRIIVDQVADCWLVVLRAGGVEKRYWVSRPRQRVVKTEQVTSSGVLTEMIAPGSGP